MISEYPPDNEALFRDLFDNAPIGYHEVDSGGHIVRVNKTEATMLGYDPTEMVGRFAWEFVVESVSEEAFRSKLAGTLPLAPFERTFRRRNGDLVPVMLEERLLHDESGQACGIRTTVIDITARKRAERALRDSEERYRMLVEHCPDAIIVQVGGSIVFANDAALKLFSAPRPESLLGSGLADFAHPNYHDVIIEQLQDPSEQPTRAAPIELRLVTLEGFVLDVELIAMHVVYDNQAAIQMVLRDITSRKLVEEQIRNLAYHDTLTQLPNRILFCDRLQMAAAQAIRHKQRLGVLFVDLDRFKHINDTLGHTVGDLVLRAVAQRLKSCVRDGDTVSRFGGDEFVLLLPGLQSSTDAAITADKLIQALHLPFHVQGRELFITASVGASILPDDTDDVEALLRNADLAMYRAKQQGRDSYQLFSADMQVRASERYSLESSLPKAVGNRALCLHYQPIVDSKHGRIVSCEALLRWAHPELGLLCAQQFLPFAEKSGQIVAIGAWVLGAACKQARDWQIQFGKHIGIAINLSARQLQHVRLVEDVEGALASSGLAPSSLRLEVGEAAVIENSELTIQVLRDLGSVGVELTLDNFGVGNCSVGELYRMAVKGLKLDGSVTKCIDTRPEDAAVARAVIAMGHSLGVSVSAVKVESRAQLDQLRDLGVDFLQGEHICAPVDALDCGKFIERNLHS